MPRYDFDLFTIGAGSGGVRASRLSASFGARVAVAEESTLGGTCVNLGCVPKKLFSYAAHFRDDFEDATPYGWDAQVPEFHWDRLRDNKNKEISRLNGIYERILGKAGVQIIEGRARVIDPHTVEVAGKRYTTERILVAVGSRPTIPDGPGVELGISSNEAFHLETFPKRALVIGGGYIAVEFAGIFKGLGAHVDLVHRRDKVLRGFDEDIRGALTQEMDAKGINLLLEREVIGLEKVEGGLRATLSDQSTVDTDLAMAAIGRLPNTSELGIRELGVNLDARGAVEVNDQYQSSVPSIYALGDVIDRVTLTPVAIYEAVALSNSLYNDNPMVVDYDRIPSAVFSNPPIATVGLTEAEAAKRTEIDVYTSSFRPMRHTISGRQEKTLMKLIVDRASDEVLGCHMMGTDAPEIIQGVAIALKCKATKAQFDATVGIHPTSAEEFVTMRTKRA